MENNSIYENYLICYYDTRAYEPSSLSDILYLKRNNNFCFYDAEKDEFFDANLKPISLKGKYIIPFCYLVNQDEFFDKINERGGIIPCDIENTSAVTHWPLTYKTKRTTLIVKGNDLLNFEFVNKLKQIFGETVFFKTLNKGYSSKLNLEYLQDKETLIYNVLMMHKEEEFIISDFVDILSDDIGKREYRVIVFDNRILNISRYTEFVLHSIDQEIYERAKEIIESLKGKGFPSSYTLDLFEYFEDNKVVIDVLEFNPIYGSGLYLYNSLYLSPVSDILHQNVKNVSYGKEELVCFCKEPSAIYKDSLIASNYYEKGSFVWDLKNIEEYYPGKDFKLDRHVKIDIASYEKTQQKEQKPNEKQKINLLEEFQSSILGIHQELKTQKKLQFIKNIGLERCPVDIMYLCERSTPREIELLSGVVPDSSIIRIKPEALKRLNLTK